MFTNMFTSAINWRAVEENADVIARVFENAEKRQQEEKAQAQASARK